MLYPKLLVERSQYNTLIKELSIHDRARFKNYARLSPEMFDAVLERLTPRLQRQGTKFRNTIPPGLKSFLDIWQLVPRIQNWVTTSELARIMSISLFQTLPRP